MWKVSKAKREAGKGGRQNEGLPKMFRFQSSEAVAMVVTLYGK